MNMQQPSLRLSLLKFWLLFILFMPVVAATSQQLPDDSLRKLLKQTIADSESFKDRYVAEVWLTDMSYRMRKRIPNAKQRLALLQMVHSEAIRANLKPELVLSVIHVESNFDRFAISRVGARGLMQVMPFWIREIGRNDDNLFDAKTNLRYGCSILKHYIKKEKGNLHRALARYNGSIRSNKYPRLVFNRLRNYWYIR